VGACDGRDPAAEHHRRERRGPRQHPQPVISGLDELRVGLPDRRGDDYGVRIADLRLVVADIDRRT
jgi:hypothetical protein